MHRVFFGFFIDATDYPLNIFPQLAYEKMSKIQFVILLSPANPGGAAASLKYQQC